MSYHFLFVYGTLKSGHVNNRVMTRKGGKAYALGPAVTREKLVMTSHGVPCVGRYANICLPDEVRAPIAGEVFLVDDVALANCDRLEGHPDMYRREAIDVELTSASGPKAVKAFIYLLETKLTPATIVDPKDGVVTWEPGR